LPNKITLEPALVQFADLVSASASVASVSSRLEKIGRLKELLVRLAPDEIETAVAFLSGSTRQGRIGVGYRAIAGGSDVPAAADPSLTIGDVDRAFERLASLAGAGSVAARGRALADLFRRATRDEQDFLRRLLFGELRQGALEGVLVEAIARAAGVSTPRLRRAAMMTGDLGPVARAALTSGPAALDAVVVQLMRPIRPMLAESGESVGDALETLGDAALEYKLDGARIQIHKSGEDVRIFSRTLRDVTDAAPEVVSAIRALPVQDAIFDGEVIALRPDGRPHPFQITMSRFGRTREIERGRAELPLTPFLFDCLYADGVTLIDDTQERRLHVLNDIAGTLTVPRIVRPTLEAAQQFASDAVTRGHEGVMAKDLTAPYAAGRRGASWLKIKQARTLDLVVLAAEWGHGRRRGWLSNLHLGARDPVTNSFVMLGKTFKGMTDQMLEWQTTALQAIETGRDSYTVYVRPELVVEIAFNEIQTSPIYPGGLALRFARVKRYRTDKSASEADTIQTVRSMAS
jgi:DNA ligase-1